MPSLLPSQRALPLTFVRLATVAGLAVSGAAQALTPADLGACTAVVDSRRRLECFDQLARAVEAPVPVPLLSEQPAPTSSTTTPVIAPSAPQTSGTLLERQWDLLPGQQRGVLGLSGYKPMYFLVHGTTNVNNDPRSPTLGVAYPTPADDLNSVDAKLQLSFKLKALEQVFGTPVNVWLGYTQQSLWQLGNKRGSSPFRDTVYEPEVMATFPLNLEIGGARIRMAGIALNHQSNGQAKPESRSWNRLIGQVGIETDPWTFELRAWKRVMEDKNDDDNPDLGDHAGRAEITAIRQWGPYTTTFTARHSMRLGRNNRGSAQFDLAFPIAGPLRGHFQLFTGYAETLLDYNHRQTTAGIGLSYNDPR